MAKIFVPKERRQYDPIDSITEGLDRTQASTLISKRSLSDCSNVNFDLGKVCKAKGNHTYPTLAGASSIMKLYQYVKNNLTKELICHSVNDVWKYVDSVAVSILGGASLTGDEDDAFCSTVCNDLYVFSNGIAPIWYYSMGDAAIQQFTDDATMSCQSMAMFGERLNLYRPANYPRRVKCSVVGGIHNPPVSTDWTDSGSWEGDIDSEFGTDEIMCALRLNNYMILYGKQTIVMQEYAGQVTKPFNFYKRVTDVGTCSRRGVCNIGQDRHVIVGWDNIYLYRGSTDCEAIGDKIKDYLFARIDPQYIGRTFIVYNYNVKEVRIYYVPTGSTICSEYVCWNMTTGGWTKGTGQYTGFGTYFREISDIWVPTPADNVTWEEDLLRWNDVQLQALAPAVLMGDDGGDVWEHTESDTSEKGVAISAYFDTKDFTLADGYRRKAQNWFGCAFEAAGSDLYVRYSTDLGVTWSTPELFTLTSVLAMYSFDFEAWEPQVRIQFYNNEVSGWFEVNYIEIGYIGGSDRGVS